MAGGGRSLITADLVRGLVAEQFPQWADRAVTPVEVNGWDNTTFRLGDDLSVRLPSGEWYAAQVDKEQCWLPYLAPRLPLPIPHPVAKGEPTETFPYPWSVYRWIEGEPASLDTIADLTRFAVDLGRFLRALYGLDASDGPRADARNRRGGPLSQWDDEARWAIDALRDEIDADAATALWDDALDAPFDGPPVWVHGDVGPTNLLLRDGELAAVIDFGCAAVGDPACDLMVAWLFFHGESRAAFRQTLGTDDATWLRGRGWMLWKAMLVLQDELDGAGTQPPWHRVRWRAHAREVIDDVLAG